MTILFGQKKLEQQLHFLGQAIRANFTKVHKLYLWRDLRCDEDKIGANTLDFHMRHREVPPKDAQWSKVDIGSAWSGRDDYFWLKFYVPVEHDSNEDTVVYLDIGRTGDGNNFGFEGLVYLNGQQSQAVDSNHQEIFLDSKMFSAPVEVMIAMWTGLEGGGPKRIQTYQLSTIEYGNEHRASRRLYRYMANITELIPELRDDDPLLYSYKRLTQRIFAGIDWSSGIHDGEVEQANSLIDEFIRRHGTEKPNFKVAAIGHTHIDVAWLWRYRHTREKVERTFNTVLSLMDKYPTFHFFFSSPQMYAFITHDNPALMKKVLKHIDAGRWEPDGGTWVEPDTNIPSGESLTRQFLYGTKLFHEHLKVDPKVLWLPDVFGYSDALPQIMLGFGINNFVTSKIGWNDTNRMPDDTFYWSGIDGSTVLTYFITTAERDFDYSEHKIWKYTYNGELTPRVLLTTYREYKDKQINNELLVPYGYGDGGGGPTREMVENLQVMNELPGLPSVTSTRVDNFFDELRARLAKNSISVPTWSGELYLEFRRGTYTSQAYVKQQNRRLEFAVRNLEIMATTAMVRQGKSYPKKQLDSVWQIILRSQFHDVLPGSSIGEVYEDVHGEYGRAWRKIKEISDAISPQGVAAANPTKSEQKSIILENPNLATSSNPIFVESDADGKFVDENNVVIPAQRTTTGYYLNVNVSGMSSRKLNFIPGSEDEQVSSNDYREGGRIVTKHYSVEWNRDGQLTSIFDYDNQREVIDGLGNVLSVYEDRPVEFDAWNIDADYVDKQRQLVAKDVHVEVTGPITTLEMSYSLNNSSITQVVRLSDWSRRIDFDTQVDWHEHQTLLRTSFDLNVLADSAVYDIQYGNIKRPVNNNTSWQKAQFEVVGHKWADLSQRDYGVALLNDSKYGYAAQGNTLSLSLLTSGIFPDPNADQGDQHFLYSLLPHEGDYLVGNVENVAMELNNPVKVYQG